MRLTKSSSPLPLLRSTPHIISRLSSDGVHYNPPTGYIFGEKPPPKGQKRVKEDWELIYYWGMGGGMALAAVMIYFKPDTSLEGWARKEAKTRMAEKGETPTYVRS